MNGAFVFIDEPEISLHPNWQSKILDYYKSIFTNEEGMQTSQLFVVTHSPFIIHNETRRRDKVIVLSRDESGNIVIMDKPEYYKCTSIDVVQDAFSIPLSLFEKPTAYLEGRTDEKYFNKVLEVYNYSVPFRFSWIGHMDEKGQEVNTGKDSLNRAMQFLIGRNLPTKNVFLFDCDTRRTETQTNNVYARVIPTYENSKQIRIGIENALVLDSVNLTPFYTVKMILSDYGGTNNIVEFRKMDLCDYLCELDAEQLKAIFIHLKEMIDRSITIFHES